MLDAKVDTDHRQGLGRAAIGSLDLAGEGHVPPAAVTAHGGGHDSGGPAVDAAGELTGGLV
jgi:hypothetical protein